MPNGGMATDCLCNGGVEVGTTANTVSGTTYICCGQGSYTMTLSTILPPSPTTTSSTTSSTSAAPSPLIHCGAASPYSSKALYTNGEPFEICFANEMSFDFCTMPQDIGLPQDLDDNGHILPYTLAYPFLDNPDGNTNSTLYLSLQQSSDVGCANSVIAPSTGQNLNGQGTDDFCTATFGSIYNTCRFKTPNAGSSELTKNAAFR